MSERLSSPTTSNEETKKDMFITQMCNFCSFSTSFVIRNFDNLASLFSIPIIADEESKIKNKIKMLLVSMLPFFDFDDKK